MAARLASITALMPKDRNHCSCRRVALASAQMLGDVATPDWPAAIAACEAARHHALRPLREGRHRHFASWEVAVTPELTGFGHEAAQLIASAILRH